MLRLLFIVVTDVAFATGLAWAFSWISAAISVEQPSVNAVANKYKVASFVLFMLAALLLLSGSVVSVLFGKDDIGNILGWSGLVAANLSAWFGIRYGRMNCQP